MDKPDSAIDAALQRWIDFCVSVGVSGVFDAGIPGFPEFHEHVYSRLRELDRQGKLPIYVDGCYVISAAWEVEEGIKELKRLQREYNTEHIKIHTLKIFMDGTLKLHSGAMVTPYVETGEKGCTAMNLEELVALLKMLNKEGLDFHAHTVGEASSRLVLDGVEQVKKELGDDFRIRVVSAHLQIQDTADLTRFAPLGVIANFTPWWHADDVNVYKTLRPGGTLMMSTCIRDSLARNAVNCCIAANRSGTAEPWFPGPAILSYSLIFHPGIPILAWKSE